LTTYTWDGENRMVVVGLQDGTLTTLTYDATGLRRKSQAGAATTNFVLDGQDVLLETDGGGTTQAAYTHGREPTARSSPSGGAGRAYSTTSTPWARRRS